jgi:competence protein ComEC
VLGIGLAVMIVGVVAIGVALTMTDGGRQRVYIERTSLIALLVTGVLIAHTVPVSRYQPSSHTSTTGFLARQRHRASLAIERIFRDDAPLAKALLIADQHEIPKDVKNRYATAGIIHMLSISGLHVAIIAGVVELLFHVLRFPVRLAKGVSLVVLAVYVAMLGFQPSAVRSGVMLGVSALSHVWQRPTSRWAALAVGAIFPLIDPTTVLNLGYQLSVAGIAGLIASSALSQKFVIPHVKHQWLQPLARSLVASSVATLVSAPLVAWSFGRVSIIAPFTNLVADPIIGLIQPMLFLALLLAPCQPLARFVADAAHPALVMFDAVARYGASIPYASLQYTPSRSSALFAGVASAAMVVACVSRFPARALLLAGGAVCLLLWM